MTETDNRQRSTADGQIDVATVHQTAVSLLSLDHQNFWQVTAQYLLALTVLAGFVTFSGEILCLKFLLSALGIHICYSWSGNIGRSNSWRDFRAEQIEKIETLMPQELRIVTEAERTRKQGQIAGPSIRTTVNTLPWAFGTFFAIVMIPGIISCYNLVYTQIMAIFRYCFH